MSTVFGETLTIHNRLSAPEIAILLGQSPTWTLPSNVRDRHLRMLAALAWRNHEARPVATVDALPIRQDDRAPNRM